MGISVIQYTFKTASCRVDEICAQKEVLLRFSVRNMQRGKILEDDAIREVTKRERQS